MSEKKKPNRNRTKTLTIRLTKEEYDAIHAQANAVGYPTLREFILKTAGCRVYTNNDKKELQKINEVLADYDKQLRGMATNINQLAYIANAYKKLPQGNQLQMIFTEVQNFRKEVTSIWESIRQQIKLENTPRH